MVELTPNDILHKDWMELDPDDEPFCVYGIFEGDHTMYVGKSTSVFNRIAEHFNPYSTRGNHQIQTIAKTFPDVLSTWKVRFYTLEDCKEYLLQKPEYANNDIVHHLSERRAEIFMIHALCPCLNGSHNVNASQIPEQYERIFNNLDNNAVDYLNF